MARRIGVGLFPAALVAALGFGAGQAVASPATVAESGNVCVEALCDAQCLRQFCAVGACVSGGCRCSACPP